MRHPPCRAPRPVRARIAGLVLIAATVGVPACTRKESPPGSGNVSAPTPSGSASARITAAEGEAEAKNAPSKNAITTPVRFVGRFVKEPNGEGRRFAWPGSAVIGRFKGTAVSMHLRDEGWNLFQVIVDGEFKKVLKTDAKHDHYVLADDLTDGVHQIEIHRRTESKVGEAIFYSFEPKGTMLPPPPAKERKIEIIGDSISTGYGNEGPGAACGYVNSQQNEYLTYGAIAARELDADHTTIAWSGKTLHEMRDYFTRTLPAREDSVWDYAQYQPQVVVVNLGTNNFANIDPGEARYVKLYHELIERVRGAYPKAFIVCALGSMLSDIYPDDRKNLTQARKYMRVAVTKLKEQGDKNLEFLEFPEQKHTDGLGCGFHPSLKTHKLMADRLVPFVKEHLGW